MVTIDDVELEGEGNPASSNDANNNENSSEPPPAETIIPNLPPPAAAPPPPAPELPMPPPEPPAPPTKLPELPASHPIRNRKPSHYLHDILEGRGTANDRVLKPNLLVGIHVPAAVPEANGDKKDEGELLEPISALALVAEMSDAHSLKPRTVAEAMRSPAWPQWKEVMEEEHAALEAHQTWCLEKLPPGVNIVGC